MSLPLVAIIIKDLFFWIYQASAGFFVPCYLILAAVPRFEYAWKEDVRNQLVSPQHYSTYPIYFSVFEPCDANKDPNEPNKTSW